MAGFGWALLGAHVSFGQPVSQPPPSASEALTPEVIQGYLSQVDQAADLDEAGKLKARQLFNQALGMLDEAAKSAVKAAEFDQQVRTAPTQVGEVKRELGSLPASPPVAAAVGAPLGDLAQLLTQKEEDLAKAKDSLGELEASAARRVGAAADIPARLTVAQDQRADADRQLAALANRDDPPTLKLAQRTLQLARRQAVEAEIHRCERELAVYDATAELLPLQQRLAAVRAALAEDEVSQWRAVVNQRRQQETAIRAERARIDAVRAHPALQPLAESNRQLAEEDEQLAGKIERISQQLEQTQKSVEELKKQFKRTQDRVETVGLSNAVGMVLRVQRAGLTDVGDRYRTIRARQPVIRSIQLKLFELEDRRSETANFERQVERTLTEIAPAARDLPPEDLELAVRNVLKKQGDYLDALIRNYRSCLKTLVDLDNAERALIDQTQQYAAYIDERVLWIRSADLLHPADFRSAAGGGLKLLTSPDWLDVAVALPNDVPSHPLLSLLAVCVFLPWLLAQRRLRHWLARTGELAIRTSLQQILPTLYALLMTILVSAWLPCLLWYVSWRLSAPLEASDLTKAVATALAHTAWFVLPLDFFRHLCRRHGLAEAHFGWPAKSLLVLRRCLRWFLLASLPIVFFLAIVYAHGTQRLQDSLGRLGFIGLLLLMALFMHCVLRPSGSLFRHMAASGRAPWLYRFRHLGHALGLLAPLALAVLTALGYDYTAYQLAVRLQATLYLALALTIVGAFFFRWILVIRRRLAVDRSRRHRLAAQQAERGSAAEGSEPGGVPIPQEVEPDLTIVTAQTRRLTGSALVLMGILGIWLIWSDMLPALGIFKQIPLWYTTVQVAESTTAADGSPATWTVEKSQPITLADLALALLILLMTLIAVRNIAGMLEIAIPRRLPLDAGLRYAIATLSRYFVTALGIVIAFSALGIGWSKVQWLVAAISLGLGFGLQEIFANFVSGLIILFERPIRVGDIVTIADVTGVVSRIRIRATTITNWDRKEFIVPNKEFVTGRVLNWSLSDPVNRVVVNVGIAYGSDTNRATELLLKTAGDHPIVLDDPAPMVTFDQFGDSALNLVLRCFLPNLDNRLPVIHDLHTAIHRTFKEAGIEIAFPQRDIHIRGLVPPLPGQEPNLGSPAEKRPPPPEQT